MHAHHRGALFRLLAPAPTQQAPRLTAQLVEVEEQLHLGDGDVAVPLLHMDGLTSISGTHAPARAKATNDKGECG